MLVMLQDRRDHVLWLVERKQYEEALEEVEVLEAELNGAAMKVTTSTTNGHGLVWVWVRVTWDLIILSSRGKGWPEQVHNGQTGFTVHLVN